MDSLLKVRFKTFEEVNGMLCAYESGQQVPFEIRRVFTVSAKAGDIRGDHAHRQCTQLLVCVSGSIRVDCDDGFNTSQHLLDNMGSGLLIAPGVWARQKYMIDDSVLMVLCDRHYEESDYIRDYHHYKEYLASRNG